MIGRLLASAIAPQLVTGLLVLALASPVALWGTYKIGHSFGYSRGAYDRDYWWRGEIAAKTGAIAGSFASSDPEIVATDEQYIEKLGDTDDALAAAEVELEKLRNKKPEIVYVKEPELDVCPRIPAICVRQ